LDHEHRRSLPLPYGRTQLPRLKSGVMPWLLVLSSCGSSPGGTDASTDAASAPVDGAPAGDDADQERDANPEQDTSSRPDATGSTAACPASMPDPSCKTSCTAAQASSADCYYEGWCCRCGYLAAAWMCQQTSTPAPCPASPPANGTTCDESMVCAYCQPTGLIESVCEVGSVGPGQWSIASGGDPCSGFGGP
jgi:hypothetical protein